jgi:membrane-associated phospholipid phosphatase
MQLVHRHDRESAQRRTGRSADGGAAIVLAGGLSLLAIGLVVVRDGTVPRPERSLFHAINDLPGWLYPAVWPFQQVGALAVGPVVAIVALALRRRRLALAAVLATALKLVTERLVKALASRQRPGTSIGDDVELRGDVSAAGESFVSGHAVLVASLAAVVTPYLPGHWKVAPWLLVAGVLFGRVYVGAHNPLDVVCGAGLGVAIGAALNLLLRVHPRRLNRSEPLDAAQEVGS